MCKKESVKLSYRIFEKINTINLNTDSNTALIL